MALASPRLAVLGIRPAAQPEVFGPPGIHLRWSFPAPLGFPPGGFTVFRRRAARVPLVCAQFDQVLKGQAVPNGWRAEGLQLFIHEDVTLEGTGTPWLDVHWAPGRAAPAPPPIRVVFEEAVVEVEARFRAPRGPGSVILQAHDERGPVAESSATFAVGGAGTLGIRVRAPAITHAFLIPAFGELHGICTATHASVCAARWGAAVAELPLLAAPRSRADALDLLAARVGADVNNRYARSFEAAMARYADAPTPRYVGPVGQLLTWLQALVEGWDEYIENPDDPRPDHRRAAGRAAGAPLRELRPQALLLLAALDPNIARLLSLGWIDRFGEADSGDRAREGRAYDYKVVGGWRERELCGLLLGVGAAVDGLPAVDPRAVRAQKIAGTRWAGTQPRYRVGVRWDLAPGGRAVRAVAFDVWRRQLGPSPSAPVLLTEGRPAVVGPAGRRQGGPPHLVDPGVPPGTFAYHVAGIDIFGQTGAAVPVVETPPHPEGIVTLADIEAPPAPSRLEARLIQPGYPWLTAADRSRAAEPARATLGFRYGAAHHRRAPDIAFFSVRWRRDRVTDPPLEITAAITSDTLEPIADGHSAHRYVVEVLSPSLPNPGRFVGGTLSSPVEGDDRVAVPARVHLRISEVVGGNRFRLAASAAAIAPGPARYLLASDSHRREGWSEPIHRIPARPSVRGTVRAIPPGSVDRGMRVTAWPAPAAGARMPDPYALLPASRGPALPATEGSIDVLVDRALLEPDLFAGGRAEADGREFEIVATSAGPAHPEGAAVGNPARVHLRPLDLADLDLGLAPGAELRLHPASDDPSGEGDGQGRVAYLEIDAAIAGQPPPPPGGELAFDVRGGDGLDAQVTVVAEVVSDVEWRDTWLGVLVRFPPSMSPSELPRPGTPVVFFPDYVAEFAVAVQRGAAAGPGLALGIAEGAAVSRAYFAVSSTDLRNNEGALSAPAQVTAVKPPPQGRPHAPFPCGHPERDGYASPPDRDGRARVCVAWTYGGPPSEVADLRFEVGRALDQSIVASDRRNWLIGRAAPGRPPEPGLPPSSVLVLEVVRLGDSGRWRVTADFGASPDDMAFADGLLWQDGAFPLDGGLVRTGDRVSFEVSAEGASAPVPGAASLFPLPVPPRPTVFAEIRSVSAEGDLYRVGLEQPEGDAPTASELVAANGGCLVQDGPLARPHLRFQITRASAEDEAVLLLRPMAGDRPSAGPCRIEPPPDYSRLAGKPHKIRQLADKPGNEDAFGVVTGVPVSAMTLRDEIPGRGRNAYFYRARAVDSAHNRSDWSPTSVPFWPADTTPPAAPRNLQVLPGHRSALLMWSAPLDVSVTRFRVHRLPDGADPALHPALDVPLAATQPRRPRVVNGAVGMPARHVDAVPELTEVLAEDSPLPARNLFVAPTALTRLEARRLRGLNPLVAAATPLRVTVDTPAGPRTLTRRPGSGEPLVMGDGGVDLTFGLDLARIRGVYRASDIPEGAPAETILALPDLLRLAEDASIDLAARSIAGLGGAIPDGLAVVAVVESIDGSLRVLRQSPGEPDPLRVAEGALRLDAAIADDSVLEVTALDGPHARGERGAPAPDLRLTRASRLLVDPASGRVTGATDLNPLVPDGTAVAVTLWDTRGMPHRCDGDRAILTWRDAPLEADRLYTYSVAAVREVTMADPRDGAVVTRSIPSALAGPVRTAPLAEA